MQQEDVQKELSQREQNETNGNKKRNHNGKPEGEENEEKYSRRKRAKKDVDLSQGS